MEEGLYQGYLEKQYDKIPALRSSDLKKILRSPAHYKAEKDGKTPPPSAQKQKSFDVGDAFHAAVLEPQRYAKQFVQYPEDCLGGKGMRARRTEFEEKVEAKGQTILTGDDFKLVDAMAKAVWDHPDASQLLNEDGLTEVTGYFIEPVHNVPCKFRVDYLNKKRGVSIDLKSDATDVRPKKWRNRAFDLDYHIQGGFYNYGLERITMTTHLTFIFIAVEKEYPHGVYVYEMDNEMITYGQIEAMKAIKVYAECLATDVWPCYPPGIHTLALPGWVQRQQAIYG